MKKNLMIVLTIIAFLLIIGTYALLMNQIFSSKEISHATYTIEIMNFAFNPIVLTINAGDTVIWTNKDSAMHTITSDAGTELNSPTLEYGQTYSHTFNNAGTYNYHCSHHPSLRAIVIVE